MQGNTSLILSKPSQIPVSFNLFIINNNNNLFSLILN